MTQGVTQSIVSVIGTSASLRDRGIDLPVLCDAAFTLSSLANSTTAIDSLMNSRDVQTIVGVLGSKAATDRTVASKFLKPVFRVLQRVAARPEGLALLKAHGCVDSLVAAMEANPNDPSLLKAGASVLDSLVSVTDLNSALETLANASASERAKQLAAAMVGNLALTGDNLATITSAGGLQSLLAVLEAAETDSLIEATSRALGRLCMTATNVEEFLSVGGIEKLLNILRNHSDKDSVVAAVDGALTRIAHFHQGAVAIDSANGLAVVMWALESYPEFDTAPAAAVSLFVMIMKTLGSHGADMLKRCDMLTHTVATLSARPENERLALLSAHVFSAIIKLIGCTGEAVEVGVIEVAVEALKRFFGSNSTATQLLQLLYTLSFEAAFRNRMIEAGVVSPAVCAAKASTEGARAERAVIALLERLVNSGLISEAIRDVQQQASTIASQGIELNDVAARDACVLSLTTVECYAKISKCANMLLSLGAPAAVMKLLNATVRARTDDLHGYQESLLVSSCECLDAIARSNKRHARLRVCELAVGTICIVLKKFLEFPNALTSAAQVVKTLAGFSANVAPLHAASVVKYLLGAAKAQPSHTLLQTHVAQALQLLATDSETADAIVRAGGARILLSMASSGDLDAKMYVSAECASSVLDLVGTLAEFGSAKAQLEKQTGVVELVCETIHRFAWSDAVVAAAESATIGLIDGKKLADLLSPENAHEIGLALTKTQYAAAGCLSDAAAHKHGSVATAAFSDALSMLSPSLEAMQRCSAAAAGLAWLSESLHLVVGEDASSSGIKTGAEEADPQQLAQLLVNPLEEYAEKHLNLSSCIMLCIAAMAPQPVMLDALLNAGAVQSIVLVVRKLAHENVAVTNGLKALTAICETSTRGVGMTTNCGGIEIINSELAELEKFSDCQFHGDGQPERAYAVYDLISAICQSEDEASMQSLLSSGIVPKMIEPLGISRAAITAPLVVQDKAIVALSTIAMSEANCRMLCQGVDGTVTEALVAILEEQRIDRSSVVEGALHLLGDLMCIPENASTLKEFGAANAILNAMSRYPTHTAILKSAAETLKPIVTVADVSEIVGLLQQVISSVASGDSRVANSASSLLRKLGNLFMVEDIVAQGGSAEAESLAMLLLSALKAGEGLEDVDVASTYESSCVAAISRFCHVDVVEDQLPELVASVVEALNRAAKAVAESNDRDNSNLIWCTTSCGIMAENTKAAGIMASKKHNLLGICLKILDQTGSDKFLAFACLSLIKNLALVDASSIAGCRGIESVVSVMRQHFDAPGVLLAGTVFLGRICEHCPSAPMIAEGGFSVLFDVLGACYKNGRILKVWGKESASTGGAGDASVGRVVFQTMTALKICGSAMPSNHVELGKTDSLMKVKSVAVGALSDEELLTLTAEIFASAVSADGKEGDAICDRMCSTEIGIPQFMLTALSAHPEYADFALVALALLERLLSVDSGRQAIDSDRLASIIEDLIAVNGESSDVGACAVSLRDSESSVQAATPETVIETLRTFGSYVPHMPERADLAPHVLKYSKDLAAFSHTPSHADLIMADNGVESLLACLDLVSGLDDFDEKEEILAKSTETLSKLEETRSGYRAASNPQAVGAMLDNLRNNMRFGKLCEYSLGCLRSLGENSNNLAEIEKQGGLELILQAIQTHDGNTNLQREAALLCKHLATIPKIASKMVELGIMEALLGMVGADSETPGLLAIRLNTLSSLAASSDRAIQQLRAAGGIATVLNAMRNNTTSSDVCREGMKLLSACGRAEGFVEDLRAADGVNVVLAVMTSHAFDDDIDGEVLGLVASKRDVLNILEALDRAKANGDVAEVANLLSYLANYMQVDGLHASEVELAGPVMEAVRAAMEAFPDSDAVCSSGFRVLAEMVCHDEGNTIAKALQDEGQVIKAIDILKNDSANVARVLPALVMLEACACDRDVAIALAGDGIVNALVNAFRNNKSNPTLQARAVSTLAALSQGLPCCQDFLEAGGLSALVEMLQIANQNGTSSVAQKVLEALIDQCSPESGKSEEDCKVFSEAFLSHPKGMSTANESTDVFADEEGVLASVAKLLRVLAAATGKAELVFGSPTFKSIIQALRAHPEMRDLAFECVALVALAAGDVKMQDILSQTGALSSMSTIQDMHADDPELLHLCEKVLVASGNADFEHLTADEATDKLKQAHASGEGLADALANVAKLAVLDGEARNLMMNEDLGTFDEVVGIVGELKGPPFDIAVLDSAVSALDQVPINANTAKLIVESGCIDKLLDAMRQYPDNIELLLKCIRILGKMAINDTMKPAIISSGGVELVIAAMVKHNVSGVVFSILHGLLFFGNPPGAPALSHYRYFATYPLLHKNSDPKTVLTVSQTVWDSLFHFHSHTHIIYIHTRYTGQPATHGGVLHSYSKLRIQLHRNSNSYRCSWWR